MEGKGEAWATGGTRPAYVCIYIYIYIKILTIVGLLGFRFSRLIYVRVSSRIT